MNNGTVHYLISWAGASIIVISLAAVWISSHRNQP